MFSACFCPRDHPRACGEHLRKSKNLTQREGSSPRLRGTLLVACSTHFRSGIIPALAGNTHRRSLLAHGSGDHPRACGEHASLEDGMVKTVGSSPRLRGTRGCARHRVWRGGIIPALAGNTPRQRDRTGTRWDHPRACGEHLETMGPPTLDEGSSPRLRGTLAPHTCRIRRSGIIPALAGNTVHFDSSFSALRDHPRACGEHDTLKTYDSDQPGSSPRLRGTRYEIPIIPTYQNEEKTVFLHFFSSWSQ